MLHLKVVSSEGPGDAMELAPVEVAILNALAFYVVGGVLEKNVTVGELIAQTGFAPDQVNGALCRLMGRNWLTPENKYVWTHADYVHLAGEGLARAAAAAALHEQTLYEVKVGGHCFLISYQETWRAPGIHLWLAFAHRADLPTAGVQASASGVTRVKARDAVVEKLRSVLNDTGTEIVPCDEPQA